MNREVAFCTGGIAAVVVVNTLAGGYFSKFALQPVLNYFEVAPGFEWHTMQNSSRAVNQTFVMHRGVNTTKPLKNNSAHSVQTTEATGAWTRDLSYCARHAFACTPSGLYYKEVRETTERYNSSEKLCAALEARKLRRILFCGDSFVRHAFEGFLLILTGDYGHGAMTDDAQRECVGESQFEEKYCRHKVATHKRVCGVDVTLSGHAFCHLDAGSQIGANDVVVWGFGNHPYDMNYDLMRGVYDAHALVDAVFKPLCSRPGFNASKVIYLHNHARLDTRDFPHQTVAGIRKFATDVGPLLEKWCGISNTVDAYNLTSTLVHTERMDVLANMTHDRVHWSRTVNVIKGWLLIKRMLSLPSS